MFERYTERARRTIFFARYEASQYGSAYIETEHLLLGLLREDNAVTKKFLSERGGAQAIREEIEAQIKRGERISTSVEIPLSTECKHVLIKAAEEASRLGHKHIGTEHLLLGMLCEEDCLAARLLRQRGLKADWLREELSRRGDEKEFATAQDIVSISQLVDAWSAGNAGQFANMFAADGQFVDTKGDLSIGPAGILEAARVIFTAPGWAACKGKIEDVQFVGARAVMATLIWERDEKSEKPNPACVRMTVILTQKPEGWTIARVQATALHRRSRSAAG
jgi:uncharacterized protein (TIGR02246 family)